MTESIRADAPAPAMLEVLSEAVGAIAAVLDVEQVLQLIVDRVRSLVGSSYAALGIVAENGRIERFITSGITPESERDWALPLRDTGCWA